MERILNLNRKVYYDQKRWKDGLVWSCYLGRTIYLWALLDKKGLWINFRLLSSLLVASALHVHRAGPPHIYRVRRRPELTPRSLYKCLLAPASGLDRVLVINFYALVASPNSLFRLRLTRLRVSHVHARALPCRTFWKAVRFQRASRQILKDLISIGPENNCNSNHNPTVIIPYLRP